MKHKTLRYISWALAVMCRLTHPFHRAEILLTGQHCHLSLWSLWLDEKYGLRVWEEMEDEG